MAAMATGSSRVARVYAEALLANAEKINQTEAIGAELEALIEQFRSNPQVASFIASPVVSWRVKEPVLLRSLDERVSPLLRNFIGVLNKNGRLGMLDQIQAAYRDLLDTAAGRVRVKVKTAVPIDQNQRQMLESTLARSLGKTPVLNMIVEPELLGGIVVQVGDRVMDASVRTRIQTLRAQLMERGSSYVLQN